MMNDFMGQAWPSPCLARCTTSLGDDVCRGCGCTFEEVTLWATMDAEAQEKVWRRLIAMGRQPPERS